jgi:hypothetical protein
MQAVCTSEKMVNFNMTTQCYIPEASKLHEVEFVIYIICCIQFPLFVLIGLRYVPYLIYTVKLK